MPSVLQSRDRGRPTRGDDTRNARVRSSFSYEKAWQRLRESKPITRFRNSARSRHKHAAACALQREAQINHSAESRRITQFHCPNLSEKFPALIWYFP